jgi:hypothetical protein
MSAFVMPTSSFWVPFRGLETADRVGLTTRQVRRLARRYAAAGPAGLISKRFNRLGRHRNQDLKINVRGFWAYIVYREAQNPTRDRFGQGDRASAADRYGPVESRASTVCPKSSVG